MTASLRDPIRAPRLLTALLWLILATLPAAAGAQAPTAGAQAPSAGAQAPTAGTQAEIAGRVKTLEGQAWLVRASGERESLAVGTAVSRGDSIETAADAAVGITFRDETRLSIGPGSEVAIDDFAFAPERDQLSFAARIARGTLLYVSGAIARLAPERVTVATPDGTVGVRGTTFLVRVGTRSQWVWPW
jgi:hypothetical protein